MGADQQLLKELRLIKDIAQYNYIAKVLVGSEEFGTNTIINDKENFKITYKALGICDFTENDRKVIYL